MYMYQAPFDHLGISAILARKVGDFVLLLGFLLVPIPATPTVYELPSHAPSVNKKETGPADV